MSFSQVLPGQNDFHGEAIMPGTANDVQKEFMMTKDTPETALRALLLHECYTRRNIMNNSVRLVNSEHS